MEVVNIKKEELKKNGYNSLEEWLCNPNHIYIGRNMEFYVRGAKKSIWCNPFSWKKYGREKSLEKYENYILNNKELFDQIDKLKGKKLGCWCKPLECHGDIINKTS